MEAVLKTLSDLVALKSINPDHEGGVPEEQVAQYVERFFAERGIETFRQDVLPGRQNVIARLPGLDPQLEITAQRGVVDCQG